ncbi:hypothetical protein DPMN_108763 [Dreissena polymorpha]|uniref:Secreted protein n=1 Tax=Dreissena polymorpha TaxID=45954 RepID=A0A9D4K934_DREPO|nr:hypothetical protein DPMN_108763 [Dreissena polymorpha]
MWQNFRFWQVKVSVLSCCLQVESFHNCASDAATRPPMSAQTNLYSESYRASRTTVKYFL